MNHHQTLLENTRKHWEMRDFWSIDTNQDRYQDWDLAKLKVLIVILSSYEVKAISNTYTCISTLMKDSAEKWTDIFIDACFYPSQPMQDKLTELQIPIMTGISSHRDWRDYDIVAISHSISLEALNIPHIYSHSNFPFSHEERFQDPNCPIVIYGGAASATMFPSLGGKIKDHGTSLYDIGSLGMGEPILPPLFKFLYDFNLKTPIKSNKQLLIDQLLDQEIFSTRLFYPFLYNISHSKGKITSIERLDPRIPEKAKLNRIHFPNFKGFNRKYFAPNGIACERHDVQVASGCSSYCCSFKVSEGTLIETENGLERIENLVGKPQMIGALNHEKASAIWEQPEDEVYRVTTDQGVYLDGSKDHRCLILEGLGLKEVLLKDLKEGDKVLIRKGQNTFGDYHVFSDGIVFNEDKAELIGFMIGDGFMSSKNTEIQVFYKPSEEKIHSLLVQEFGEQPIRLQHTCKDGTPIYCYDKRIKSQWFEELNIRVTSLYQCVPDVVFKSPKSVIQSFLRGLFTSEGFTYSRNSRHLGITTTSFQLAHDVNLLLLMLGYNCRIIVGKKYYYESLKKRNYRQVYQVLINGVEYFNRFYNEIGFINKPYRQEKESRCLNTCKLTRELLTDLNLTRYPKYRDLPDILDRLSYTGIVRNISDRFFITHIKSIEPLHKVSRMFDIEVEGSHTCVYNGLLTHNCAEGQEGGHYTEKPIEEIEQDILESKCYSAANNYNAFSFNCNYYSQYFDMLKLFITHSSSTSIFNQRADVLGNSPDYVAAARKMGVMKISTACEGISERIRQNILNKNLPRKTLVQACKNVFIQKMLGLKFTMILTGLETKEDLEDFYSTIDEILRVRTECHSNTKISLTFTPLLYYIQTPFRWVKRVTSKASWEHERILTEMIPFLMDRGIKMKFYGSGITTYFEQLVIDAGWQSTNILMDLALKHNIDYTRGVPDSAKPIVEEILKEYDIPFDFFFDGFDPNKDILPNDMLEFTTSKKLEEWKEMFKKNDYYHPLCLRTAANMNAKCYNCGGCSTVEEKKSVFARSLNDKSDLNSVLAAMTKAKPKSVIRFVVKQFPLFAFYSKEMLSHYITSQFIRRDEKVQKSFYKIGFNSTTWVSDNFQLPMYSGLFVYDVEFKSYITAEYLKTFKDEVNTVLETCQIVDIIQGDVQDEVDKSGLQLYLCKVPFYTPAKLKERLLSYDWQVKVAKKAFPSVKFVDADFTPYKDQILFKENGLSVVIAMALPIIYNPFSVIASITKKPLDYCYMNADVQILDTGKEIDASCKCGEHLYYSWTNNKIIKECPRCRLRKILSVIK
jgi:intein/homing endonuclease